MSKDFSKQDLHGHSFRGQDLRGADFSHADIQGACFRGANLEGANFTGAACGLGELRSLPLFALIIFLALINAFFFVFVWSAIVLSTQAFDQSLSAINFSETETQLIAAGIYMCIFLFTVWRELHQHYWSSILIAWVFIAVLLSITGALGTGIATVIVGVPLMMATTLMTAIVVMFWLADSSMIFAVCTAIVISFTSGVSGWIVAAVMLLTALLLYWRMSVQEDSQFERLRHWGLALKTVIGTDFRDANLTQANFSEANLAHARFSPQTDLTHACFQKADNLNLSYSKNTLLEQKAVRDLLSTGQSAG